MKVYAVVCVTFRDGEEREMDELAIVDAALRNSEELKGAEWITTKRIEEEKAEIVRLALHIAADPGNCVPLTDEQKRVAEDLACSME